MAASTKEKNEVATTGNQVPDYIPGIDWNDIVQSADTVAGHDLAKDELLDALAGVPFAVTRLVFRKGYKDRKTDKQMAYASVECVIADEATLKRRRVNMANLPFEPGQQVIFNDGSTGIYRQMVSYLEAKGFISVDHTLPEKGAYGESRYDSTPVEWAEIHNGEVTAEDDGWLDYTVNVRLVCPRGIRISEYETDYSPDGAVTRYIA